MAKEETAVEETTEETATTTEAPAEEVQEREPENSPVLGEGDDFDPLESGKSDAATNLADTPQA